MYYNINRWINRGVFPKPVWVASKRIGWDEAEIRKYIGYLPPRKKRVVAYKPYYCSICGCTEYILCKQNGRPNLVRQCKECNRKRSKISYLKNYAPGKPKYMDLRKKDREQSRQLKLNIIKGYGGKCTCCGETYPEFLCIDHIHGGGHQHRKKVQSQQLYYQLKREGFPKENYRLLCWNCNSALGIFGYCLHQPINEEQNLVEDVWSTDIFTSLTSSATS